MSNTSQSLASTRINALLDENSFVEIGGYVTARSTDFNMHEKETPGDGVVTGYGVIDGNLVYVYSQDASVLGGTIGEMHAKKITALYDMAMKMGAPVIGLIDCAGIRLQEATDALNAFGEIYLKQTLASGVIPQITAVFGTCGGGLALVPALTDFTFMESKKAKLFVNSPNALDGNHESKCDTASAKFQSEDAGLVDFTGSEDEIYAGIRELVSMLPSNNEDDMSYEECTDDLNRASETLENAVGDPAVICSEIGDDEDGNVAEKYADVLTARGARKAAKFVKFCDAFEIPVLTLTNLTGFKADLHSERCIANAAAELTYAFADATVAKVNVITGKAFGSVYTIMNSKALGADMTYAWENAEIGMMDARSAAKIMYDGEDAAVINEKAAEYAALQSSALSAAKRGYVDTIIDAKDTRKYLIGAFEMLFTKREDRPGKKHGTV